MMVAVACVATGCVPASRVQDGRYVSSKGYAVAVPPAAWMQVPDAEADVAWQREAPSARMLVSGSCEDGLPRRSMDVLTRQLIVGLRQRTVIERGETSVAGRPAGHVVVEGRADEAGEPLRVEAYVVKDARCVYDFLYAAPASGFETVRAEFRNVVQSFRTE